MARTSRTLFDEEFRLEKITAKKDSLERLNKYINWEIFRLELNKAFEKEHKGTGGRPPYDYVMFGLQTQKVLLFLPLVIFLNFVFHNFNLPDESGNCSFKTKTFAVIYFLLQYFCKLVDKMAMNYIISFCNLNRHKTNCQQTQVCSDLSLFHLPVDHRHYIPSI